MSYMYMYMTFDLGTCNVCLPGVASGSLYLAHRICSNTWPCSRKMKCYSIKGQEMSVIIAFTILHLVELVFVGVWYRNLYTIREYSVKGLGIHIVFFF